VGEPPSVRDKSRIGRRRQWSCSPSGPLFQLGPAVLFPVFDGFLVALIGPAGRLLQRESRSPHQPTDVRRVVSDPELSFDELGYPLTRPHLPPKAVSLRIMMGQKLGQSGAFFLAQARRRSGRRLVLEALHPLLPGALHPLALTAPSVTPRALAISVCFQPRSFSSKARKRLPSRQSPAWFDNVFSIVEAIIPISLGFYAEISKAKEKPRTASNRPTARGRCVARCSPPEGIR
jgi:hypothetical protein